MLAKKKIQEGYFLWAMIAYGLGMRSSGHQFQISVLMQTAMFHFSKIHTFFKRDLSVGT